MRLGDTLPHDPIPSKEPTSVTAGDTWQWTRKFGEHTPADGWDLTYYLKGPSVLEIEADANAEDDGWDVTVDTTDTADLTPAAYELFGFLSRSSPTEQRFRVYRGKLAIALDPAGITAQTATKSEVETIYDAIVAQLTGRLTKDQESIAIDGTSITRIPIAELVRLRGIYAELLRQELHPTDHLIRTVQARDVL